MPKVNDRVRGKPTRGIVGIIDRDGLFEAISRSPITTMRFEEGDEG
jgi:hypothetical protein